MKITKSKIFFYSCLAFVSGIAGASFFIFGQKINPLWWFVFFCFFIMQAVWLWAHQRIRLIALILAFFVFGLWRYTLSIPVIDSGHIAYYNGQTATIIGEITKEPKRKTKTRQLNIVLKSIVLGRHETGRGAIPIKGEILVTTGLYPVYNKGDILSMKGKIECPKPFAGFAYDKYLHTRGIYSVLYFPQIQLLVQTKQNIFSKDLSKVRNRLKQLIISALPAQSGGIARAIVLGDKSGLSNKQRNDLSRSGLSHIVAISGLHISILSLLVMNLFLFIGLYRKQAFYGAVLLLFFYIALVGAPASAVRAGLMGFFFLWALKIGRIGKIYNLLLFSATLLLLGNPFLLRGDLSFQLSFLAVWGIVAFFDPLTNLLTKIKIPPVRGARDIFIISICAQIFTWPLIALKFNILSLLGPLVNVALVWLLAPMMIFLLVAAVMSALFAPWAAAFFLPARLIIDFIIFVAHVAASQNWAVLKIKYIWGGWLMLYYFFLLFLLYFLKDKYSSGLLLLRDDLEIRGK